MAIKLAVLVFVVCISGLASCASGDSDSDAVPIPTSASGEPGDTSTTSSSIPSTTSQPAAPASDATISGPIAAGSRGGPGTATPVDLAAAGYVEEEFFLSGEATSFVPNGELSTDGKWDVVADEAAPFTTRMLVRRPDDATVFSGTVLVEWFNVSSNVDVDVDFGFASDEILRSGDVWVGVSAQQVGITSTEGGDFGVDALGLRAWDPERYGDLEHPGDAYSYDIFSQAGHALRNPRGTDPLAGYDVEQILAMGESQSAFRLLTYVNAVHPLAEAYDGFLIHSRDGGGAPLVAGDDLVPSVSQVRTDLDVPVLQLVTETDLFGLRPGSAFPDARQADTDTVRTWEMAGTAHADAHYLASLYAQGTQNFDSFLDLTAVIPVANRGPQRWIVNAALNHLRAWAAEGAPPPSADPIETNGGAIVRDEHGNALGGIRTPAVEVPTATLTGEGTSLIGSTTPLTPDVLAELYPSPADYLTAYEDALEESISNGFILEIDAEAILDEALLPDS